MPPLPLPLPAPQVESITEQRLYALQWNQRIRRKKENRVGDGCHTSKYLIAVKECIASTQTGPNYGFNHHTNAIFSWNDGEVCCAFSQYNFGSSMYGVYQRQYDHGAPLIDQRHDDSGFNTIGAERFHALRKLIQTKSQR
eukprot:274463_1